MSVVLFIIAVIVGLFLYDAYKHEQKHKESPSHTRSTSFDSGIDMNRCTLPNCPCKSKSTVFKMFLRSLNNQADNNNHALIHEKPNPFHFRAFKDRFQTLEDVTQAIQRAGLEKCQLILGVDFTASNEWQGRSTNKGRSLHHVSSKLHSQNPYQHVISILGRTIISLLTEKPVNKRKPNIPCIHAYGFGDSITKDKTTFPLNPSYVPCCSFDEVQKYYRQRSESIVLGGPTSYAPVIHKAIEIVQDNNKSFHILVIIADGQFVDEGPTAEAIVEASKYPLSIVVIGVGDGPWDMLKRFDDWLPQRKFDNFQFVDYSKIMKESGAKNTEASFALHALMEIPDQYKTVQDMGFMEKPPVDIKKDLNGWNIMERGRRTF